MKFEQLDSYLLRGTPTKKELVGELLADRSELPAAGAFYSGLELLGERAPDLSLLALRLVLAGKKADDESVVRLRGYSERARGGDSAAREAYYKELA
ncbi:MAG: hypothetical protein M3Y21_01135 [Candidatus Eremiobacteraeota bacterium]|nr:hypothetical protein [Candidatus Eremiobacteraeota bacterium]